MVSWPGRLVLKAALILAASGGAVAQAADIACRVAQPPMIAVKLETADIAYDFSKTARDLTALKGDTSSPYPPGSDSVSGGLREVQPEINSRIAWELTYETGNNNACLAYKTIDVTIKLAPKIYVAREFNRDSCRNAILQHERKHVETDRIIMNKFAATMGRAVQGVVDKTGALGPFPLDRQEEMKDISSGYIEKTLNAQISLMEKEMRAAQKKVDSLEEYEYVSGFCRDVDFPR